MFVEPSSLRPPSLPPARLCYPQINSCLDLDTLNGRITAPWNFIHCHSVVNLYKEDHFQDHVVIMGEMNAIQYRNKYCTLCNGVDIIDIECFAGPPNVETSIGPGIKPVPFNIILDIFGKARVATASQNSIHISCSEDTEVYDPMIEQCRPIVSIPDKDVLDNRNNINANCSTKLIALIDPTVFEFVGIDMLLYNEELYTIEFSIHPMGPPLYVLTSLPMGLLFQPSIFSHLIIQWSIRYSHTLVALCQ